MGTGPNQNPSGVHEKVYAYIDSLHDRRDVESKRNILAVGSGEWTGHFFDFRQEPTSSMRGTYLGNENTGKVVGDFLGSGINRRHPHPDDFQIGNVNVLGVDIPLESGLLDTRPPATGTILDKTNDQSTGTGILSFNKLINEFSSASGELVTLWDRDFEIFGDYIHYLPYGEKKDEEGEDTTRPIPGVTDGEKDNRVVRVPFVADLIPTTMVFDRYKDLRGTK